jgi:hypothetical protein
VLFYSNFVPNSMPNAAVGPDRLDYLRTRTVCVDSAFVRARLASPQAMYRIRRVPSLLVFRSDDSVTLYDSNISSFLSTIAGPAPRVTPLESSAAPQAPLPPQPSSVQDIPQEARSGGHRTKGDTMSLAKEMSKAREVLIEQQTPRPPAAAAAQGQQRP